MTKARIFSIIIIVQLLSSCTTPLFVSDDKWKTMRTVVLRTNQPDITVKNKKGEVLDRYSEDGEHAVFIEKLKRKNMTLTLSHPDRVDTTVHIKRKIRSGAMIADFLFIYSIPTVLPIQFLNSSIYKISPNSRDFTINLRYSDFYYEKKFNECAKNENIDEYKIFIIKYPNTKFAAKAQQRIYDIEWDKIKNKKVVSFFEKYINKYPQSTYNQIAQDKIYNMAYNDALLATTVEALEDYINKYPNSPKLEEAKRAKSKTKEIDEAYQQAKKTNNYIAYKKFIDTYEQTKFHKTIAHLMLEAYCKEKSSQLENLQQCNDAIKYVKDIQEKFEVISYNLKTLTDLRDNFIASEIQKCKTKDAFYSTLLNQAKIEKGNENTDEGGADDIKTRILNSESLKMNGTYIFYSRDGCKESYVYLNGKKNGSFIKFAPDQKNIVEKGEFVDGKKDGIYVVYFESGKTKLQQNWNNGFRQSEIEYDESGKNLTAIREAEQRKAEELREKEERKRVADNLNRQKQIIANQLINHVFVTLDNNRSPLSYRGLHLFLVFYDDNICASYAADKLTASTIVNNIMSSGTWEIFEDEIKTSFNNGKSTTYKINNEYQYLISGNTYLENIGKLK